MTEKMNEWIKSHWQVATLLCFLVAWGVRLEGQASTHQTREQALRDKADVISTLEQRLDSMSLDISTIKADVAYLRGIEEK